jgi:thiamine monophosphate kinase
VEEFAKSNGVATRSLILEGGEEYLIVGTMKPGKVRAAARVARVNGGELVEIGRVTRRAGSVTLRAGGRTEPVADSGWVHLR